MQRRKKILATFAVTILAITTIVWTSIQPSNNRNWNIDQAILPEAAIDKNLIHIKNIRNFIYHSPSDFTPGYYDSTFDLNKIKNIYYVVEPFSTFKGAAHTFVSFEFEDNQFVSISVEIRKEQGESFSAIKGLFKQYEIMYVIADERDVIKLRSNYRHDDVYVYPIKTTKEHMQQMFLEMVERANHLKDHPEFYNTLTNTCTTNIVRHVNKIVPGRIPLDIRILFPGYSDKLAYDANLIDTTLPFEQARKTFHINQRAETYADSPDFSQRIRMAN